jgi:glycosyltransferase involved in cell wall biosynthesis
MAGELMRRMRRDGLAIDFLPINPEPPGLLALAERVKILRTLVVSAFYCTSLLREVRRYDLIHLFSASYLSFLISQMPAILVARLYRKPLILNYRSGEAEDHLRRASRGVLGLLRMCQAIVVPSGFLVEVFARFGFRATAIANVVDPTAIRPRHRESAEPRIVVPRALEPLYNVACAIRAFAIIQRRFPEARLTILGQGSEEASLRRLARELGLRHVEFTGWVERSGIGDTYDRHDILVNTSSIDNMPVSLLEGFAAGLPIVTTNAGGIPHLVQDRVNAHLVEVDDHEAIAARVIELVENPEEVARLSRASRDESRKYTWEVVASRWYGLYERCAAPEGPKGRA